jgi:hypothetical protein
MTHRQQSWTSVVRGVASLPVQHTEPAGLSGFGIELVMLNVVLYASYALRELRLRLQMWCLINRLVV